MSSLFKAIQDLLFPPHCLACTRRLEHSQPPLFCSTCLEQLPCITSPLCTSCGRPFTTGDDHLCSDCLQKLYFFDLARSLYLYKAPGDSLILPLKFEGQLSGLPTLTALMARWPHQKDLQEPDYIVPVPLHTDRLRKRGFNQAILIAKACFPDWKDKIHPHLLIRSRKTTPQAQLSGVHRRRNLQKAFLLTTHSKTDIRGRSCLIVDDVFTTGSTVNECARVLRQKGAARIEVFTLARSLSQQQK